MEREKEQDSDSMQRTPRHPRVVSNAHSSSLSDYCTQPVFYIAIIYIYTYICINRGLIRVDGWRQRGVENALRIYIIVQAHVHPRISSISRFPFLFFIIYKYYYSLRIIFFSRENDLEILWDFCARYWLKICNKSEAWKRWCLGKVAVDKSHEYSRMYTELVCSHDSIGIIKPLEWSSYVHSEAYKYPVESLTAVSNFWANPRSQEKERESSFNFAINPQSVYTRTTPLNLRQVLSRESCQWKRRRLYSLPNFSLSE